MADSFERQLQRWFLEDRGQRPPQYTHGGRTVFRIIWTAAGALAFLALISAARSLYANWLWYESLGYGSVYTTIVKSRIIVFSLAAFVFASLLLGNLVLAIRLSPRYDNDFWAAVRQSQRFIRFSVFVGTAFLSIMFGIAAQANWQIVLRFLNAQPFGIADPVFHREISFYVFSLPFLQILHGWFLWALIIVVLSCAGTYFLTYSLQRLRFDFARPVSMHIGGLVAAILGLFAWGYWLSIWELVFSATGVIFGAGYADLHAKLPAKWILLAVVVICIALLVYSIARRNLRLPLYALGGWVLVAVIIGGAFPGMVQRFQVEPNELAMERQYIEYNIQFTREAFALNRIEERPFPAEEMPSLADLEQNEDTIANIRLWDPRPLKDTYNQIQSFRLYYDFNDVDIDRYDIDGDYRQVMISVRELSAEKLAGEAQTWVNRQLQFTHGYGVTLSPVNEITARGLPVLLMKDIPPAGKFEIKRPQIYFGEKTGHYVIVHTNTEEFDYPMGDENVYGRYEGKDGVSLGSFMRRLIYAWEFGDINILISGELTKDSKILYHRNIRERVNRLAPFLKLDADPYPVVLDGRIIWIQDAYTTSDRYPYSQPTGGLNYIRNSVKAVIDAYDGSVTFYVTDPEDALIRTYQSIFPDLFLSAEQLPESIRKHIRYPEDMFTIQANVYRTYHMRDARVFYNKEDLWEISREVYAGREQLVEPYYIIMRLPGEDREEFLLILPFTPARKNNAIGWLAARSDGANYGQLLAYFFPKERLVYGPSQIENRIQQDTLITEQLALWSRGGSRVIRGNLLLIPIGNSNLYVEPVFLQADEKGLPELKRVIVAAGDRVAMRPSLAESIAAIYGTTAQATKLPETPAPPEAAEPLPSEIVELIGQAQQHYQRAQESLKAGDWTGYGAELEALKAVLDKMGKLTAGQSR